MQLCREPENLIKFGGGYQYVVLSLFLFFAISSVSSVGACKRVYWQVGAVDFFLDADQMN